MTKVEEILPLIDMTYDLFFDRNARRYRTSLECEVQLSNNTPPETETVAAVVEISDRARGLLTEDAIKELLARHICAEIDHKILQGYSVKPTISGDYIDTLLVEDTKSRCIILEV